MDLNRYELVLPRPSVSSTTDGTRILLSWALTLSTDPADGSSRSVETGQNNQCTRSVPPRHPLDRQRVSFEAYYLPVLTRQNRLLRDRSTGQKTYCTTPATSAFLDPMTLPIRPRARFLQGRHVRSDQGHGLVTSPTSPRLTTAHSGHPPGPAAGNSARGCSARGTSGAIDPGSPT